MDDLTKIARECDARWRPRVGDRVRVAAHSRMVVQVNSLSPRMVEAPEGLTTEVVYIEQFIDHGYHPTHHSCSLAQWRTWARLGHEDDRMYR